MRIRRTTPPKISFAGKIKIGETRVNRDGKKYPTSLDYFKMYCDQEEYVQAFKDVYGNKPNKLTIIFPMDSDNNLETRKELRDSSGKLAIYGDGTTFHKVSADGKAFQVTSIDRLVELYGSEDEFYSKNAAFYKSKWKERLWLTFMLPELKHIFAYWRLETSGEASSIQQIESAYDTIKAIAGTTKMIAFDLIVKKTTSDRSGSKSSYPVVSLIPNLSTNNALKVRELVELGALEGFRGLITDESIKLIQPNETKLLK